MPSQSSIIEVAGRKIQMTQGGQGTPLLYLHSAAGETDWTGFHEQLSRRYHVYLPAHPGFAVSGGLESIHDIQDLAWHTIDLIAALGLSRVSIVGFSLGGWLAAEVAILRPALVEKLVLVSSAGIRLPDVRSPDIFLDDREMLRRVLFHDPDGELARNFIPQSAHDERMLLWIRAREASARVAWNPYFHNPKLPGHLHRISTPTMLLWGRNDQVFPLALGEAFRKGIPDSQLAVIENCGHMLPFEKPDEFVRLCVEFLG
jgi:pimeloyl-ACP methyl ester carboxylesterase